MIFPPPDQASEEAVEDALGVGAGAACVLPAAGVEEANNVVAGQFRDVPAGGECVGELVQDSAVGDARLVR